MKKVGVIIFGITLLGMFAFQNSECATLPPLNKKILAFVKSKIGKPVTNLRFGYCFDLVEYSYKAAGIEYVSYNLGKKVDHTKECVFPGDVIGFGEGVKFTYVKNDTTWTQSFTTTEMLYVIYKVKGKGDFVLAHEEDFGNNKRKVILMDFKMSQVIKGKPKIYRPTK